VTALHAPILMLVTEARPELTTVISEAVEGGVNVVQLRGLRPGLDTREAARAVRKITAGRALMVVNLDICLARECQADGAHLPVRAPGVGLVRKRLRGGVVGRSIHTLDQARFAEMDGADYVLAGTIFASNSHPDIEPAGLDFLAEVCRMVSIPVIAIGGVTPENAADCTRAGAVGVAVLSPIMRAVDPRGVAARYWEVLRECSS
jgi:thiamine-phosphate diphosphorylase